MRIRCFYHLCVFVFLGMGFSSVARGKKGMSFPIKNNSQKPLSVEIIAGYDDNDVVAKRVIKPNEMLELSVKQYPVIAFEYVGDGGVIVRVKGVLQKGVKLTAWMDHPIIITKNKEKKSLEYVRKSLGV